MRRIVESTRVSLDGVIGDLQTWGMDYLDADALQAASAQLADSDGMLMGRNTYQALSAAWSGRGGEFADAINAIPKYVISSTLEVADWNNATILTGDVVAAVSTLKAQDGKDLVIYGHGPLGELLLERGLLDRVRLSVHPILVGTGALFFRPSGTQARLRLVGAEPLPSGVVVLTYETTGARPSDSGARAAAGARSAPAAR
jgi:dihydrofolate reductase